MSLIIRLYVFVNIIRVIILIIFHKLHMFAWYAIYSLAQYEKLLIGLFSRKVDVYIYIPILFTMVSQYSDLCTGYTGINSM